MKRLFAVAVKQLNQQTFTDCPWLESMQIIRKEVKDDDLPGVEEYKEMCQRRRREL